MQYCRRTGRCLILTDSKRSIAIAVTTFCAGGVGTYIGTMGRALRTRGWEVHIIASHAKGDLFDECGNLSACHDFSNVSSIQDKIIKIADLLNKISPSILLLNHCAAGQYTLPLLSSAIKPVAVIHSDDSRYYATASRFSQRIFRWVAPAIKVAQQSGHFLRPGNDARIRLIPHGVDNTIYHPADKDQRKDKLVTFVGYLDQNKGVDLLIPIFEAVSARFPDAVFAVIGDGPMRDELERSVRTGLLRDKCTFTGLISPAGVADIFRRSAVFLLPTRIEGFGLAIAEAMLSGAIPVVTRIPGVTDQLLDNSKSGFLVDQDDVAGFAKAVNTILSDESLLQKMSETATCEGERRFSLSRMIGDYEEMFQEQDDRPKRMQRSKTGWLTELVPEVIRSGSLRDTLKKGKHLFR